MTTIKQASKILNIYPQTKTALTAWEKAMSMTSTPRSLKIAAQGIQYALGTGRLSGGVDIAIRQMKPYQGVKLLVKVEQNCGTIAEVPRFLNCNMS